MSDPRWLCLSAIDSWMFRDGRPFDQNDAGAAEAVSVFPPWPPTLAGVLRAALWQGPLGGKWDAGKLGDGTDWQVPGTLGPLSFTPPVLLKDGAPLYPAPLNILRDKGGKMTLLRPGAPLECDMGRARLPVPDTPLEGAKTPEGDFLTAEGLERVLAGGLPDPGQIVAAGDILAREARVGIGIDPASRRVREGMLYMAHHVRPAAGVALAVGISGWEGEWPARLMAFGGEHRMAEIAACEEPRALPAGTPGNGGLRLAVALSPVVLEALPGPGKPLEGLGRVVSACLGKPVRIGGWDSRGRRALPMRLALPAGSVWFLEGGDDTAGMARVGIGTEWGFGALALGKWEETR